MKSKVATRRSSKSFKAKPGFTIIELVTVIVILGILSAVALPVYLDYKTDAQKAACKGVLGAMRAGIANFYAYKATESGGGTAGYPTLAELTTVATVMIDTIADNPYDADATKNNVVDGTGVAKGTVTGGSGGWQYNPTTGQIWPNTNTIGENAY
ncbi:MAG: prepilin-type N-terminal cleavage/methylation domain-containing protein [Phycisphaerae bacterium]